MTRRRGLMMLGAMAALVLTGCTQSGSSNRESYHRRKFGKGGGFGKRGGR